jgi:hypothetical protein
MYVRLVANRSSAWWPISAADQLMFIPATSQVLLQHGQCTGCPISWWLEVHCEVCRMSSQLLLRQPVSLMRVTRQCLVLAVPVNAWWCEPAAQHCCSMHSALAALSRWEEVALQYAVVFSPPADEVAGLLTCKHVWYVTNRISTWWLELNCKFIPANS